MKKLCILGATGSIGTQSLDVVSRQSDKFAVCGLTANSNINLLEQQIREFKPLKAAIADKALFKTLKNNVADCFTEILCGEEGVVEVASMNESDIVVSAIVGAEELYVTLKQNEAITLWSDLSVATDICMVEAGALDGTYSVEGFEFSSASGSGEWFVKLEQPEEWPEKADGYVWMRAACIFDFAEDAEEEPEVKPNPYIPVNPSVPVIPENPELPDDVDVPILDENGDVITEEGKQLVAGAKATLSAWSVLGEDVSYQW